MCVCVGEFDLVWKQAERIIAAQSGSRGTCIFKGEISSTSLKYRHINSAMMSFWVARLICQDNSLDVMKTNPLTTRLGLCGGARFLLKYIWVTWITGAVSGPTLVSVCLLLSVSQPVPAMSQMHIYIAVHTTHTQTQAGLLL